MYSKEYIYTSMRCHTTPVHLNSTLQQYAMSYYNSMLCHTTPVCKAYYYIELSFLNII